VKTLGIDQSLTNTGMVVLTDGKPTFHALIKTAPKDGEDARRHHIIAKAVIALAMECDYMAMESQAFSSRDTRQAELAGVLKYICWRKHLLVLDANIGRVKKLATGNGRASKQMMIDAAVAAGFAPGANEHLADAYWIARFTEQELVPQIETVPN
jgi:Holliday junction resolvasome RuvABC endonuclease subunit